MVGFMYFFYIMKR